MQLQVLRELGAPEALRKAADILSERGWVQGVTGHKWTGRVDIFGALGLALGAPESSVWLGTGGLHEGVAKKHYGLYNAILNALDVKLEQDPGHWNDVPERTKDQVIDLLRSFANEIEGA